MRSLPLPRLITFAVIFGLFGAAPDARLYAAEPPTCVTKTFHALLTIEQRKVLWKALESDYDIQILGKEENGQKRMVILAGETHVKSGAAAEIGRQLLSQFQFRGLEGASSEKLWAGWFLDKTMAVIMSIGQLIRGKGGSTITESSLEEIRQIQLQKLAEHFAKNPDQLNIEKLKESTLVIQAGGQEITLPGTEILERVQQIQGGTAVAEPAQKITNLHLEADHKPNLAEQLAAIHLPTCVASLCVLGLTLALPEGPVLDVARNTSLAFMATNAIHSWGSKIALKIAKPSVQNKSWAGILFFSEFGLLQGRNKTMIDNIELGFKDNPDSPVMVVVVGRAHLPGMKQFLQEDKNYVELPIAEAAAIDGEQKP